MIVRRGFGLLEFVLAGALFAVVGLLSFLLLSRGVSLWRQLVEAESAGLELAKAVSRLRRDVVRGNINQCSVGNVPAGLPAGASDGSALWFLSAVDPSTDQFVRKPDGTPFWQRNVLYYLVVPAQHDLTFGITCAGGAGPGGFDDRCPHKVLIRKVIDSGVTTTPGGDPDAEEEQLLGDVSTYLTRPSGFDTGSMGAEPGVQTVEVVAARMLWFQANCEVAGSPREVSVDLRAVAVKDAEKEVAVGTQSLAEGRFTLNRLLSVIPMN